VGEREKGRRGENEKGRRGENEKKGNFSIILFNYFL
jgi:hypothetical protein